MSIDTSTKPLSRAFNVAVQSIASRLFPAGYDVADVAPSTLVELQKHVAKTGRMLVWSGASDKSIFACQEANYAFRAWHDWTHLQGSYAFNDAGELAAYQDQAALLGRLFKGHADLDKMQALLRIEIIGQIGYAAVHNGEFPTDQYAFAECALTMGLPYAATQSF